jgi:imidazolonepropionase-like amidohydrolase
MGSDMIISNALIFDGESPELTEGGIRIADGDIVEIGKITNTSGTRTLDAAGRTVIPGLIDAHFHAYAMSLHGDINESTPLSYIAFVAERRLGAALSRGFTTVRDVAGGDSGLSDAIRAGLLAAPRYLYTGPAMSQTGGHGDPRSAHLDQCIHGRHMCEIVDGEDAVRRTARERFRRGAHALKMMTSGGVVSLDDPIRNPQYSSGEIRAAVDEAERRGSYVAAHAYSPESIRHSIANGIRSIEHGNLLDDEVARLMAEKGAFLVPTLVAYDAMDRRGKQFGLLPDSQAKNREVLDSGKDAVTRARAAGVSIGFGSDLMGELEDDQLLGLQLQCEPDGILNVLRSATSVNASLIRRVDLGRIAIGAKGDVVVLDGNPFDSPSVLWDEGKPRVVIQNGSLITTNVDW